MILHDGVKLLGMNSKILPKDVLEFFRKAGRKGGKLGGKAAAESMTPEQRTARARKGAAASAKVRSAKVKKRAKEK